MTGRTYDTDKLTANAQVLTEYADQVRAWTEEFDDPQFYDSYSKATGFIGAPMTAALRENGRLTREVAQQHAARIQAHGEQSLALAQEALRNDAEGAAGAKTFD